MGAVSLISRLYTSGDENQLTTAIFSSLLITAGAGCFTALIGIFFAPAMIGRLNLPAQLKPFILPLIQIYSAGLFFQYLVINCNGILRSCNRIKISLRTMAIVCLLNIGLNILLVFFTPLGFRGIALATASSALVGAISNLFSVRKLMTGLYRFSNSLGKQLFHIGWPMGVLQALWQIGSMVLFLIISELPKNNIETLAAFTAGLRIESAIYLPAFAFNMANAVVVGNLLGEKKGDEAYRSGLVTASIGVAVVSFIVLLVITHAERIASFLSTNPVVINESIHYLTIAMISEPFMAWGVILGGGLSGAGDTRSVLIRVSLSIWLIRIPLAYLLVIVLGYGSSAVWWSMNLSQFVQAFLLYRRYAKKDWLETAALSR